jgi:aspartyl protease family protein
MKIHSAIWTLALSVLLVACSRSGRRESGKTERGRTPQGRTIVKMEKKNGVYQVPVEINGAKMFFIFDTGAGMVSISATEVIFLYKQGTLSDEDVLGTANFSDANGDISEGTVINLKTVKIGNRTLENVQASVVHNMEAPLLLGQTVLERFGRISIDNKRGVITLE